MPFQAEAVLPPTSLLERYFAACIRRSDSEPHHLDVVHAKRSHTFKPALLPTGDMCAEQPPPSIAGAFTNTVCSEVLSQKGLNAAETQKKVLSGVPMSTTGYRTLTSNTNHDTHATCTWISSSTTDASCAPETLFDQGSKALRKLPGVPLKPKIQPQFCYTKLCPFQLRGGGCINRAHCLYAHSESELRPLPDLRKTKLCEATKKGLPCFRPCCTYAHSAEELKMPIDMSHFKTSLCVFWKKGKCLNGEKCRNYQFGLHYFRFAHGAKELQRCDGVTQPYSIPLAHTKDFTYPSNASRVQPLIDQRAPRNRLPAGHALPSPTFNWIDSSYTAFNTLSNDIATSTSISVPPRPPALHLAADNASAKARTSQSRAELNPTSCSLLPPLEHASRLFPPSPFCFQGDISEEDKLSPVRSSGEKSVVKPFKRKDGTQRSFSIASTIASNSPLRHLESPLSLDDAYSLLCRSFRHDQQEFSAGSPPLSSATNFLLSPKARTPRHPYVQGASPSVRTLDPTGTPSRRPSASSTTTGMQNLSRFFDSEAAWGSPELTQSPFAPVPLDVTSNNIPRNEIQGGHHGSFSPSSHSFLDDFKLHDQPLCHRFVSSF